MTMIAPQENHQPMIQNATMTGAEMVVAAFREQGVSVVFGYPGGSVLSLFDAFYVAERETDPASTATQLISAPEITIIQPGHEQAGVHAAAGYAQVSGKPAVVIGTSGPGATNMITGIYDMNMDSIPAVIITGQVSRALQGTKAFQESNIVEIAKPCAKDCFAVQSAGELAETLHKAFEIAQTGRPGPVLVDIPRDVFDEIGHYVSLNATRAERFIEEPLPAQHAFERQKEIMIEIPPNTAFDQTATWLETTQKAVILFGGGAQDAAQDARALVKATNAPAVCTFRGLGIIPSDDPHMLGMGGMHGTFEANKALHGADLILCVGGRFDDRLTGPVNGFAPYAKIVHVNIDPESIGKPIRADIGIVADSREAMREITHRIAASPMDRAAWHAKIAKWKARNCLAFEESETVIKPQSIIRALSERVAGEDVILATDVGQHQMWTAQHFAFKNPRSFLSSGGAGTMGSGIPAAIGAQIAHPEKQVVFITGDGSIQMHIQELGTAAANNLPIKGVVLDNGYLGMVRQQQEVGFQKRYAQTKRKRPDLALIAEGYGFSAFELDRPTEIGSTMESFLASEGPALLICRVSASENCYPMIVPGKPHDQMLMGPNLILG